MGFESLITTIKNSIQVNTGTDISMAEHSSLLDLLYKGGDTDDSPRADDIRLNLKPQFRFSEHRFPIGSFIINFLKWIGLGILWLFYFLCDCIMRLFTGKRRCMQHSARLGAMLLLSAVVLFICAIAYLLVFFTNDILFFNNKNGINSHGAVTIQMSCEREHYIFLLNSATPWVNSGIEVTKGDEVTINTSGGFHGDADNLYLSNKTNSLPTYSWNFEKDILTSTDSGETNKTYIYNETDKRFGSLLFQVQSEKMISQKDALFETKNIYQCDKWKNPYIIQESGYLLFCVNEVKDSIYRSGDINQYRSENFGDNLGEILINVSVVRHYDSPASHLPHISYRKAEALINHNQMLRFVGVCLGFLFLGAIVDLILGVFLKRRKIKDNTYSQD